MEAKSAKPFSVAQICRIIRICKKNGVNSFKFGDLSLDFKEVAEKEVSNLPSRKEMRENAKDLGSVYTESENEEMQEEQLLIDDPLSFEDQQIDRLMNPNQNISRAGNENQNDRRA